MKKISVIVTLVLCLLTVNLAFAGIKPSSSGSQPTTDTSKRPRFQR